MTRPLSWRNSRKCWIKHFADSTASKFASAVWMKEKISENLIDSTLSCPVPWIKRRKHVTDHLLLAWDLLVNFEDDSKRYSSKMRECISDNWSFSCSRCWACTDPFLNTSSKHTIARSYLTMCSESKDAVFISLIHRLTDCSEYGRCLDARKRLRSE